MSAFPTRPGPGQPRPHRGAVRLGRIIIVALIMGGALWVVLSLVKVGETLLSSPQVSASVTARGPAAPRLDLRGFEAGFLISDRTLYDTSTMNLQQIADFIAQKNAGCVPGDQPCLADYRQDTTDIAPSARCRGYQGQAGENAAQIVYKTAQACGINPQVLLVILQKEQGLLTASGSALNDTRYRWAMGFACPDNQACDERYAGLATQIYSAGAQLRRYQQNPGQFPFRAGVTNHIAYAPDPACGGADVKIVNQATASLYNYTPYQPDEYALQGLHSNCASWGNLNFYGLFQAWFGNPKN